VSWFKVDDRLHSSRKLLRIPRRYRHACLGVWTQAGSWCAAEETDGLIPEHMLDEWGVSKPHIEWLVKVELWRELPEGSDAAYAFKNWEDYQPTRQQNESKREKNREKLRHWRGRNRVTDELQEGSVTGSVTELVTLPPSRPVPTHIKDSMSGPTVRPDVEELCSLLADLISGNGSKRPTVTKQWRDEARRMLDIDGRELDKVRNLIRWSQADGFWRKNILSMPKFRQRYDQLRLAALEDWEKRKPGAKSPDGEIDVDAILGRDVDGIGTPPEELWGDDEAEQAWRTKRRAERKAERLEEAQRLLARRQGGVHE
jgi:hypothetical protein